jgi:hypothetical protein
MKQERKRKQKGAFQVKRIFEPDRMAPVNLQAAYEQLVSPEQYRMVLPEPRSENIAQAMEMVTEIRP